MRNSREMLSVGIDVGTTTTQVVFSHLTVQDVARLGQVPKIAVNTKAVSYTSPIYFTPLLNPDEVDVPSLTEIIRKEYQAAGVKPADINTGAVIITGEIARTHNADKILQALAEMAGDFVVTIAGPNVEAQIAGRGASAATYSQEHFSQVTNIDVGGGTSNAAIFRIGDHLSASGLAVGGRLLVIEKTSGIVRYLTPPGKLIIKELALPIYEGRSVNLETLEVFCDCMANLIADLAMGIETPLGHQLQLTPPLKGAEQSSALFLSGGVGEYFYNPIEINSLADVLIYDDVGPLFAKSLRLNPRIRKMNVLKPSQTTRATVMGASSQTVTLSGSTIWAERELLPLRNLPVIRPHLDAADLLSPDRLAAAIRSGAQRWDIHPGSNPFAVALDLPARLDYESMYTIAKGISHYAASDLRNSTPFILIIEKDYAQVLGQTIKSLQPQLPLISIDQVGLGEGDFIDLGEPILGGRVVPLSVKTLIFYSDS